MPHHIDRLLAAASLVPAVNQVEVHPYFRQTEVLAKNAEHGILSQAWSPISSITFYPGWGENRKSALEEPLLISIGEAHGKSAAQVMLRWHLEQGGSAIPKSVRPVVNLTRTRLLARVTPFPLRRRRRRWLARRVRPLAQDVRS